MVATQAPPHFLFLFFLIFYGVSGGGAVLV